MTGQDLGAVPQLFRAGQWRRCVEVLSRADGDGTLDEADLRTLGDAAYLTGRDEESVSAYARAFRLCTGAGDWRGAVRSALLCCFVLGNAGQLVRSGAWAVRAERLVAEHGVDGAEAGRLHADKARRSILRGELQDALLLARRGEALGLAADDPDVVVLSRLTIAFAMLLSQDRAGAIGVMDEVMLAVSSRETSEAVVGLAYCAAIDTCMMLRDVGRAREWTTALTGWCDARPDLVPYRGACLVHRAQMMTLGGDWSPAVEEAVCAEGLLRGPAAGGAAYQLGELARLRGEWEAAEEHYRRANSLGYQPEPGLSLLRVARGRADLARVTLRRLLEQQRPPEDRADLLSAAVRADLALHDVTAATATARELADLAAGLGSEVVDGLGRQALGMVLAAAGRHREALDALGRARARWERLSSRTRAPRSAWSPGTVSPRSATRRRPSWRSRRHGTASPGSVRWSCCPGCPGRERAGRGTGGAGAGSGAGSGGGSASSRGGLTDRELDVIRLVAAGLTNRRIAGELRLSEKTVARHLSNVYAKLDLPSRAAATAYAYDHGLI